ncbi:GAF domain-containing SpoIIE family protein phosphatase [Streptomyces sp. NPDC001185]|uniref:PP2C family protein-serine/threonine phosphatase n=1 Tax=Streptomyces sp. NPDC001185 TaxID=3154380 RepID=UPI00331F05FD
MDDYDVDAALQAALDRLALLNEATSELVSTLDAVEGLKRVCRVLVPSLADWCVADLLGDDDQAERVSITHHDPDLELTGVIGPLPLSSQPSEPWSRVLRGAGPLLLTAADLVSSEETTSQLHAANRDLFRRVGSHGDTVIIAPLHARRRVVGALTMARGAGRRAFDEADLSLVEDLAHRMGLAVDNARLYAETQAIAERIQRSLLPTLPAINNLQMTARYVPATAAFQVGGDWYDSFVLPTGDLTLIIGDVTGHDLHAAVTMSQLRNMLRGIAYDRQEPPDMILRRLDIAASALRPHSTASCIYALLRQQPGMRFQLTWAQAGHPPPLLITAQGETLFLDAAHDLLLGVEPESERHSATKRLPYGSTLLLYTDGLVERRDEGLDDGLARLRQHATALSPEPLDMFCDELLHRLAPQSHDDIALLALKLPPPP